MVATGNEAIARLDVRPYDAIVLDVMMKDGSGHDVLHTLGTQRPGIKCVVVISAASKAELEKVDMANVEVKIRKPFDIDELVAAIERCVAVPDPA